ELAGEVVDEDLVFLPGELENVVLEDGQALAKHGDAQIDERRHLSRQRYDVELSGAADPSGTLVEPAVAEFEALREADRAAHDLARDVETQRHRLAADLRGRVRGRALHEPHEAR